MKKLPNIHDTVTLVAATGRITGCTIVAKKFTDSSNVFYDIVVRDPSGKDFILFDVNFRCLQKEEK